MDFFNMTSCEINELYKSGKLDFSTLSKEELDAIFKTETYELYRNKNHSFEVLNKCSLVLSKYLENEDPDYAQFVAKTITMDNIQDIIDKANKRKKIKVKEESSTKHIPVRRAIAIMVAAAFLVTVLSVTSVAMFDPFSELGITIREIFNMKPNETYESDDVDLSVSDEIVYYDSYEELVEAVGFEILWFDEETSEYEVNTMFTSYRNNINRIVIKFDNLLYRVYYGDNVHKFYNEDDWKKDILIEAKYINNHNVYFSKVDIENQAIIFENDLVYFIISNSSSDIIEFIEFIN